MRSLCLIAPFILILSCLSNTIEKVDYDLKQFTFNKEINYYLVKGDDIAFSATSYSSVSEHEKLLKSLEHKKKPIEAMSDSFWQTIDATYSQYIADDYIIEKAKSHEIVMFNEAHHLPRHRHYVKTLLADLYNIGYRYLALEAMGMLGDGTIFDKEMQSRGYPMRHTGAYIKEPEFNSMIREALDLGYQIIGYDGASARGNVEGNREMLGADNIVYQLENKKQNGKLIVLCGYDHIKEGYSGTYWEYALAERLKQMTGNDPLTINQTEYNERLNTEYEDPLYQRLQHTESVVLLDDQNASIDLAQDTNWYDVFVFHPRTSFTNGIPDWVMEEGEVVYRKFENIEIECPCKIMVHEAKDDISLATPIYVREIDSIQHSIHLPTKGKRVKYVISNGNESYVVE